MNFIFWCKLTAMCLSDMQYYISVENAVILLTEISSRVIKFYLFPFLISCATDFASHTKLVNTENYQYIIWKPSSSFSLVTQLFEFFCFLVWCWIISIYPSNLPELHRVTSILQLFIAEMLSLLLFGLAHF